MYKLVTIFVLLTLFSNKIRSQETDSLSVKVRDSVSVNMDGETVMVVDSIQSNTKSFKPLAPSKAAFYSAILPGLGQVYNKRYWKVPLVWGALGGSIYLYTFNNTQYNRFRTAFKRRQAGFLDDEFYDVNNDGIVPDFDNGKLESQQERFQSDRDLWLVISIAMYALNIIDANVDAHLKQFNIDDNLAMDFEPYINLDPVTNNPNVGMALLVRF